MLGQEQPTKRIAITGGAGFCGHHLALALAREGYKVGVFDSFSSNNYNQWIAAEHSPYQDRYLSFLSQRMQLLRDSHIPLYNADLVDYRQASAQLKEFDPSIVVHLAAISHGGRSNREEHAAYESQLDTLKNVRDYCVGMDVHLIFQSSSMVYGHFSDGVQEDARLEPIGYYGNYKLCCERMVLAAHQVSGLDYTIVRPSALYGPRCVSRRVVQCFVEAGFDGETLRVEGDGQNRLDFTWVEDWVDGMLRVISHPSAKNEVFNLTHGKSVSLLRLAQLMRQHWPHIPIEQVAPDLAYPRRGALSIDKAKDLLSYRPQVDLQTGLERYINWYKEDIFPTPLEAA